MNKVFSRILASGASLAALGAHAAYAQEVQQQQAAVSDEIVVTATGRQAAVQDVPLAVTAISGETLQNAGFENLLDLQQLAPAFRIETGQSTTSGTIARIRGIGTGGDNPGFESAVGVFIDGVYRSRAGIAISDLPEVERIEVLRGPQGTLFGRNTSAGAISIVTQAPDYYNSMWMEGTFGDLNTTNAKAGVNLPIVTDVLTTRFDASIRKRDGYVNGLNGGDALDINDQNRWSARGQALWDITPNASLRIIVDGGETDENCCGVTPLLYGPAQTANASVVGAAATPPGRVGNLNTLLEARNMTVSPGRSYSESVKEWGASGQLDWDFGNVNLTSITAYRDWDSLRSQDVDFNFIDIAYRDGLSIAFETFTQEVRLQGQAGPVDWLVGAFYGDEKLNQRDVIRFGAHANFFAQAVAIGNTTSLVPGGCAYYNFGGGQPSLFQCLNQALIPGADAQSTAARNAMALAIATAPGANGGYLIPNANGGGQQSDRWQVQTESMSLFTHNEISLTEQLILTLGVRYNSETKDIGANLTSTGTSCESLRAIATATQAVYGPGGIVAATQQNVPGGATLMNIACNPAVNSIANGAYTGDREENEWSGTASLAYHVNEDLMVYGGYSRGYKAGGFNVDRSGFGGLTPATLSNANLTMAGLDFEPEFVDAYELGFKSTLIGGSTNLNLSIFYEEISDYQSNNFNGFNFITANVPKLISKGVELDLLTRPHDWVTLQGGVVYNDAYYDSTVVFNPLSPAANTIFAGDPLTFAPEWTVTSAATFEVPVSESLKALFYVDGRYNSEYRTQTLNREPSGATDQDGFALFNMRAGIGNIDDHWAIEVWGRNITDEFYYVGAFQPPLQDGTYVVYPSEPRTWGVTLRARF
ncbi:MAG: TonB-dependent receptor [Hyphomonadaceae bacterium]|nr:TonB-dependent receptor [Hyphomonadaceae bacterium]